MPAAAVLLLLALVTPASARSGPELRVGRLLAPPTDRVANADAELDAAEKRYPWVFPRAAADRPDERPGHLVHVVYVVAAGMPDDRYDELGILEDSLRSMNHWMREQTGNQQWRLDTYTFRPQGSEASVNAVDVTFIQSTKGSSELDDVEAVQAELTAHGLDQPNKRYLSFVAADAGSTCGEAWVPINADPVTPVDGKYASVFLYSVEGCMPRAFAPSATEPSYVEATALHELAHNDGMVPMAAPHNCVVSPLAFGHVCTGPLWASEGVANLDPERFDLMFPFAGLPLDEKTLDADNLDYYRHPAPYLDLEQGLYLETV